MQKWINARLRDAGNGAYGPRTKAVYWFVHDHARWVGVTLGTADAFLVLSHGAGVCARCASIEQGLALVAGCLVSSGLAVGFHAAAPPEK